jgi:hypothetical protein
LHDEDGAPYAVPRSLLEVKELVALKVGDDRHLIPRDELLGLEVQQTPGANAGPVGIGDGELAGALALRATDSSYYLIPEAVLERTRVSSDGDVAAADELLLWGEAEVAAFALQPGGIQPLDFNIEPLAGGGAVGNVIPARGFSPDRIIS